jgi:hypothetical protein
MIPILLFVLCGILTKICLKKNKIKKREQKEIVKKESLVKKKSVVKHEQKDEIEINTKDIVLSNITDRIDTLDGLKIDSPYSPQKDIKFEEIETSKIIGLNWNVMMIENQGIFKLLVQNKKKESIIPNDLNFMITTMNEEIEMISLKPTGISGDGGIIFQFEPDNTFKHTWYCFNVYQKDKLLQENQNVLISTKVKIEKETEKLKNKIGKLRKKETDKAALGMETDMSIQIEKLATKYEIYSAFIDSLNDSIDNK